MLSGVCDVYRCINETRPASRLAARFAVFCLVVLSAICSRGSTHAQSAPIDAKIAFDIPAQPLARALFAYGAATGFEIFYNASLLAGGPQSDRVAGLMTPTVALQALLAGTDYIAKSTGPDMLTITRASREALPSPVGAAGRRRFEPYFATLQRGISDALCRDAGSATPPRELVYQFWISPSGVVERVDVLAENGDRADDQSFASPLRRLALATPPAGLPQPINMVIFPPLASSTVCGDLLARRRAGFVAP